MDTVQRISPHLPTSDVLKMVRFYTALGFSLIGDVVIKDGTPIFAGLDFNGCLLRIELWNLPDWEVLKRGFSVTTIWIEIGSLKSVIHRLDAMNIPYTGPHHEDYGSTELELFDPEGFRIIFSEEK